MKIKHSLVTRRQFLNSLIGGWLAALGASVIAPIIRFVFPPYREPDEVILPAADFKNMEGNTVKVFPWGAKPGLLKLNEDGSYTAFVAVCTHLDCNVTYMSDKKRFYCACHEGWYDENGVNISGPPPSPLRKLFIRFDADDIIISKVEKNE